MASTSSIAPSAAALPAAENFPREKKAKFGFWLALLACFLAEFLLFDQIGAKRHTVIYPRWNDQIQYLTESYLGYEYLREHGFAAGLWHTLVNPSAQGTLHDFFAVLIFSVTGPSRSAALSLNILAIIAWQAALAFAVQRRTGSRALAWAAAALPLALSGPWNNSAGSTADFRLDHLGMCAFGVTFASALLTDGFRSRRWSIVFGFAVGFTLLVRFITSTYFVVLFTSIGIWLLCSPERWRRFGHLLIAAVIAAVIAGPIFLLNRQWMWNYYFVGHYVGPESDIRKANLDLIGSSAFLFATLVKAHLGKFFEWMVAAGTALLAAAIWRERPQKIRGENRLADSWILGCFFILAPATALAVHTQKSVLVVNALVPGSIGIVLGVWAWLHSRIRATWPAWALAIGIVAASGWYFTRQQLMPAYDAAFETDARKVNTLASYIFDRSRAAGLTQPLVGVDHVTDALDGQIMRVICYERKKVWMSFGMTLPTGIWKEKEELLFERLAQSDFVFLTDEGATGVWPYDEQLVALRPRTHEWCDQHLQLVERFPLFGKHMALYQRREIPLPPPSSKK